jgi:cytochrome c-type biogenesis protein CcmE
VHVTIEDQIAERDKVVTRFTFCGTHQGEFPTSFSSTVAAVVTPSQLLHRGAVANGQTVRLQGHVLGGVQTNATTLAHLFTVSDGRASVQVTYGSDLPGGFKTGASVEAQGTYNGRVFTAYSLTAKCPTKYQAGTTPT